MDFGGIGFKAEQMILDELGAFIGAGYNLYGLGFNAGFVAKPFPNKMLTPYIQAMGGYKGVIVIRGGYMASRVDYGFSLGGGLELKTRKQNIRQLGIVLPFRSKGFIDYYEELLTNSSINFERELSLMALTMGYKMVIR